MVVNGEHCSMSERRADEATREVNAWLKCEYLQEHVGDEFNGVISAVTSFGLFVELEDLYIEGLVHVTALPGDYYNFDKARQRLIGERSGRSFQLGGSVRVQVARVDLDDRKIDLELIEADSGKKAKGKGAAKGDTGKSTKAKKGAKKDTKSSAPGKAKPKSKGKTGLRRRR
jgi:ribonuclease R